MTMHEILDRLAAVVSTIVSRIRASLPDPARTAERANTTRTPPTPTSAHERRRAA